MEQNLTTDFIKLLKNKGIKNHDRLTMLKNQLEESQQLVELIGVSRYIHHPLNSYMMIKRMEDWATVDQYLKKKRMKKIFKFKVCFDH